VGYPDVRITRRTLELFDWSRAGSLAGLVAERYPCAWRQESATYAMLYPLMLRNHLLWRRDAEFIAKRMCGLRQLVETLLDLRGPDGLLGRVPGWPFVDWVTSWNQGCGPGVREGSSSIVNLHLVLALQAAAETERWAGDRRLAARLDEEASALFGRILARYWDGVAGLLRDTDGPAPASEHAQVFALLTGLLDGSRSADCLRHLTAGRLDARCTISFSFYLLEVLGQWGEEGAFFDRLEFWRGLPGQGFTSLPEMPDPCRSDCHGWGAHPLFHTFATIAGIRPAEPGMARVKIRPMPGPLRHFRASIPHPAGGMVSVSAERRDGGMCFEVNVPPGVEGIFEWNGGSQTFRERHVQDPG
jgi:hypothetical protein